MEEFWKRFDVMAAKLNEAAPLVYERLLSYQQAKSVAYLAVGFVCLTIMGVLVTIAANLLKKGGAAERDRYGSGEVYYGIAVVLFCVATLFLGGATINLFYVWNWIGAFAPDARLVNEVWNGLTNNS